MKKTVLILVLIITSTVVYYVVNNELNISANPDSVEVKNRPISQAGEPSEGLNNSARKVTYTESYEEEASQLDEMYISQYENQYPIIPGPGNVAAEFETKEQAGEYLDVFVNDAKNHTLEVLELVNICANKREVLSRAKQRRNSELLINYYSAIFDRCDLITGENDIFFIVENLAQKGNKLQQLNYLNFLNDAIDRNVVKPLVDPIGYYDRREMGLNWLHFLASKGVVKASEGLASIYQNGSIVEKDFALSYLYAAQANQNSIVSDFSDAYIAGLRNQLSERDIARINRMSGGKLP